MSFKLNNWEIILLIFIVVVYIFSNTCITENFGNTIKQNDTIKPLIYEPEIHLMTSASNMIGLPSEIIPAWTEYTTNNGDLNTDMGNAGLGFNLCSKSCCSPQYPPPFALPLDKLTCNSKDKFVGSSYTCNNSFQDSGCLCMTQEQSDFIASRGRNGFANYDVNN
jgi:hypothetical protein